MAPARPGDAEDPALLALDGGALGGAEQRVAGKERRQPALTIERGEVSGDGAYLRPVLDLAVALRRRHQGWIDLGEHDTAAAVARRRLQPGLERPDASSRGEAGLAAQPMENGNAGERLAAGGAGSGELPHGLRSGEAAIGEALFGEAQRFMSAMVRHRQERTLRRAGTAPERRRARGDALVELGRDGEAVVSVAGIIGNPVRQELPERAPSRGRQMEALGEPFGIAEGKIEPGEHRVSAGQLPLEQSQETGARVEPRRAVLQGGDAERSALAAEMAKPDAVLSQAGHRGGAPIHHQISIEKRRCAQTSPRGMTVGPVVALMLVAVMMMVMRPAADAADVMVVRRLRRAGVGLVADDLRAVLAELAIHAGLAVDQLGDAVDEAVEHQRDGR